MEGNTPPPVPGSPGDQPYQPENAYQTYNESESLDVRPCVGCNGQMEFNIAAQALVCPHCGTNEEILHAPGTEVRERSYKQAMAAAHGKGDAIHDATGEKEIVCSNCNGHTTFVGTFSTTRCPYCATPIQRTDVHNAPDRLAVDGVLPFRISDAEASKLLGEWINKRWFAPDEFKKYGLSGSFESVYAAYFTYDADATTAYTGERGDDRTYTRGSGDDQETVTETDWHRVNGRVFNQFDDITILANTGFQDRYVKSLEPWPTTAVMPYSPDYLAGHLARTYDIGAEQCFEVARAEMDQTIDRTIKADIGGDHQKIHSKDTRLANVKYKHVLLPIWLLTVLYNGQPWQVFMNGATGEIHGRRPWSQVKIGLTIAAVVALIVVLVILRSLLG